EVAQVELLAAGHDEHVAQGVHLLEGHVADLAGEDDVVTYADVADQGFEGRSVTSLAHHEVHESGVLPQDGGQGTDDHVVTLAGYETAHRQEDRAPRSGAEEAPPQALVWVGRTEGLRIAAWMHDDDTLGSYARFLHEPSGESTVGEDSIRAHQGLTGDRPRGLHGLQHLVAVRVDHVGKTQPAPQPETEVALAGGGGELNGLRPLPEHDLADGRRHGQGLGQLRGGEGARPAVDVNAVGLVGAGAGRHVGETRYARGPERPGHARHVVRDAAVLRRVVRADEQGSH